MKALFVTTFNALGVKGKVRGGVQIVSNEYLTVLQEAGFEMSIVSFELDRRLSTRGRRRMRPKAYEHVIPPSLGSRVGDKVKEFGAGIVFLNLVDLAPLARHIRCTFGPEVKVVLLSHGLHSTDILHNIRIECSNEKRAKPRWRELCSLGAHLRAESEQRRYIDHVFCLSEFEVGLEQWLGSQSVSWVPRIVEAKPFSWRPINERLGFVGTLDHPPNAEGLHLFLQALAEIAPKSVRVRVVGGPSQVGKRLARDYPSVDYLDVLDDAALTTEAATWTCAVHPVFCYARGSSTKLATFLAWQIPVVTTPQGCRGYVWKEGSIPQANGAKELVELALTMKSPAAADAAQANLARVAATSPTVREVAKMVASELKEVCPTI